MNLSSAPNTPCCKECHIYLGYKDAHQCSDIDCKCHRPLDPKKCSISNCGCPDREADHADCGMCKSTPEKIVNAEIDRAEETTKEIQSLKAKLDSIREKKLTDNLSICICKHERHIKCGQCHNRECDNFVKPSNSCFDSLFLSPLAKKEEYKHDLVELQPGTIIKRDGTIIPPAAKKEEKCLCACHENKLNKSGYGHTGKCCENMYGEIKPDTPSSADWEDAFRKDFGWIYKDLPSELDLVTDFISSQKTLWEQQVREGIVNSVEEKLKDTLELHTHNSIPSYNADVNEGCRACIENQIILNILSLLKNLK